MHSHQNGSDMNALVPACVMNESGNVSPASSAAGVTAMTREDVNATKIHPSHCLCVKAASRDDDVIVERMLSSSCERRFALCQTSFENPLAVEELNTEIRPPVLARIIADNMKSSLKLTI
jgi:hypothetical protein